MAKERTLDIEKVNAALKRAARLAVTGSRDDRNGRFISGETAKKSGASSMSQSAKEK